jgi:hypothetical protein
VEAGRGAARLRYWRFGARIDIDHSIFRPGQWIDMPLAGKVGYEACTASWVLEPRGGQPLMAVTAGHCAAVSDQVYREVHGARTTLLGSVSGQAPDLDAEVFTLEAPSGWAQQVERAEIRRRAQSAGSQLATSTRATACASRDGPPAPTNAARSSSATAWSRRPRPAPTSTATRATPAAPCTPRPNGATTRAVGIVTVVVRRGLTGKHRKMCYVPIESILDAFQANFA